MILNVSGRTDIVAFYMEWFMNRVEEGYFLVRNPFYKQIVHRIDYNDVDMIVFCTKNPINILRNIDSIGKPFIVHVTLTPYGRDIEPYVPDKKYVIDTIKKISRIIGVDKVFVRYDPILLNDKYTLDYHVRAFSRIVTELNGYTKTIIVSFVDEYKNVLKNSEELKLKEFTEEDYHTIGKEFSEIASKNGMTVQTCAEERTLFEYGFIQSDCVTTDLVYKICGKEITEKWNARRDKTCHCVKMYDVGEYNTCKHFCKYCYANFKESEIEANVKMHNPESAILIGELERQAEIKEIVERKNNI